MKIVTLELNAGTKAPVIVTVDRALKQPDPLGYTYGNLYNRTYCREVNIGPARYDLLRDVEFLVFEASGAKVAISCQEIFDHFYRIDRCGGGGPSEFNNFLGLEDLGEIFKQRKELPGELRKIRLFGWQSLMYPPRLHQCNPALFVPYIDPHDEDRIIEYKKRNGDWFQEGDWYPYNSEFWQSDTFVSPRFRAKRQIT